MVLISFWFLAAALSQKLVPEHLVLRPPIKYVFIGGSFTFNCFVLALLSDSKKKLATQFEIKPHATQHTSFRSSLRVKLKLALPLASPAASQEN